MDTDESTTPAALSIGQLSTRAGIAASALRFYEDQGLIATCGRSAANRRQYRPDTLRRVAFIRAAQQVGLSLDDIKRAFSVLPADRAPTTADWEALSVKWRAQLDERISLLSVMRDHSTACIGCGCLSLDVCARSNPGDAAGRLGHGARYLKGNTPADAGIRP